MAVMMEDAKETCTSSPAELLHFEFDSVSGLSTAMRAVADYLDEHPEVEPLNVWWQCSPDRTFDVCVAVQTIEETAGLLKLGESL
jgi:hypothetical protein